MPSWPTVSHQLPKFGTNGVSLQGVRAISLLKPRLLPFTRLLTRRLTCNQGQGHHPAYWGGLCATAAIASSAPSGPVPRVTGKAPCCRRCGLSRLAPNSYRPRV